MNTKRVVITLPDLKAVSRNETGGQYFRYKAQLNMAELYAFTFAKQVEYHFGESVVDVLIEAYYKKKGNLKVPDAPNIDDKIFTDILNRFKPTSKIKKGDLVQRNPYFIEDDNPKYLRYVIKRAIASDHFKVVITVSEVEDLDSPPLV